MEHVMTEPDNLTIDLENMPGSEMALKRTYAWFENAIIDRPPVRFVAHNAFVEQLAAEMAGLQPEERRARWFDSEFQVDAFWRGIEGRTVHGETFPVFWPNLGPDVYAGFYGAELIYGESTSWSIPMVKTWEDVPKVQLDLNNPYFDKLADLTDHAFERSPGKFLVGYTDLHPGLDCVAAWRDPQQLCIDMIDDPELVQVLAGKAIADFETLYDSFDATIKAHGQPSISWMGIPSFGRMHIPSCDFSNLISPDFYVEFGLPILQREVKTMTHNVFHVDGKRVARHLEAILSVPEVHALQWVQGVGDDQPIMQWTPFIKSLQARKVPVIVDLSRHELESFMEVMSPEGLFLWIATENEEEELATLKRLMHWK